jgi:hypothetical protein
MNMKETDDSLDDCYYFHGADGYQGFDKRLLGLHRLATCFFSIKIATD